MKSGLHVYSFEQNLAKLKIDFFKLIIQVVSKKLGLGNYYPLPAVL